MTPTQHDAEYAAYDDDANAGGLEETTPASSQDDDDEGHPTSPSGFALPKGATNFSFDPATMTALEERRFQEVPVHDRGQCPSLQVSSYPFDQT